MKECFLLTVCSRQSQKWLQKKHQLYVTLEIFASFFLSNSIYVGCILYVCPPVGCFKDRHRMKHLSRGKETLVAQLWHRCSKMLYRLLTHTNRHLHKASCSASVAFRDATVNCLSSVFNQSFCLFAPHTDQQLLCGSPLCLPAPSTFSHLSSYPSLPQRFLIFYATMITPAVTFPIRL